MSKKPDIERFLAPHDQLKKDLESSIRFQEFLDLALKGSGADPTKVDLAKSRYRYVDGMGETFEGRTISEPVSLGASRQTLESLLAVQHRYKPLELMHGLWAIGNFDALREFLRQMAALVRYSLAEDGAAVGQVQLVGGLIQRINKVERYEYVQADGNLVSDGITRVLGLRAKVLALDRHRRELQSEDGGILERVTRASVRRA